MKTRVWEPSGGITHKERGNGVQLFQVWALKEYDSEAETEKTLRTETRFVGFYVWADVEAWDYTKVFPVRGAPPPQTVRGWGHAVARNYPTAGGQSRAVYLGVSARTAAAAAFNQL